MEMQGFMGRLYTVMEWVSRLLYLNVLWYIFLIPGLLIFGFGPSTAAMFAVTRKWVMGQMDIPVFKTFWQSYRREFLKSNLLTLIFAALGAVLFIDLSFFKASDGIMLKLMDAAVLGLGLAYFVTVIYLFPVFVHYQAKTLGYVRQAFVLGLRQPFKTLLLLVVLYLFITSVRGLIPVFSISTIAYCIMWISYQGIKKLTPELADAAVSADEVEVASDVILHGGPEVGQ